jgi:hypothetical protein
VREITRGQYVPNLLSGDRGRTERAIARSINRSMDFIAGSFA